MPDPLVLVAMGAVTGALSGMLGAGGGFTTVAVLIAVGIGAHLAVGTSVVYTAFVVIVAVVVHARQRTGAPRLAVAVGGPAVVTSILGAWWGASVPPQVITLGCGLLTALVAAVLVWRRPSRTHASVAADLRPSRGMLARAVAGGAAIGVLRGLFGYGGGTLVVPFMVVGLGVSEQVAVGSSLMALLPGAVSGAVGCLALGAVDLPVLALLLLGSLPATVAGARFHRRLSAATIRRTLVIVLALTACYLVTVSVAP